MKPFLTLRLCASQQRVFRENGLDKDLIVDASRPIVMTDEDARHIIKRLRKKSSGKDVAAGIIKECRALLNTH